MKVSETLLEEATYVVEEVNEEIRKSVSKY